MVSPNSHALRRTALLVALLLLLPAATGTVAAQQDLEASFQNDTIDGYDEPANGTLSVTGHTGEVTVRSDDVSGEALARMFDGRETGDGVSVDVPDDGNLTVTFPPSVRCSPEQYTFTVSDGERRANASVVVAVPAIAPASFEEATYTVPAGEPARLSVRIDECHEGDLTLRIGGQNSSVHAAVTFAPNASGATTGNVTIDTGNLTDPDSFGASSGLVRRGLSVHRTPPNGSLPAGVYDVVLSAESEEYALSTLQVEERSTPTAGGDATTADPGNETDAGSSTLDMPGFGFTVGLLALLSAVVLLSRDD